MNSRRLFAARVVLSAFAIQGVFLSLNLSSDFAQSLWPGFASRSAQAAINPCPKQNPSDKCGHCEPGIVDAVRSLILSVQNKKIALKNGQAFLEKLKAIAPTLFDNYIIMEHSDSAQKSSYGAPRILLKSYQSEVLVGFSTDSRLAGYERVELVLWNGPKGEWDYYDVTFPEDMAFGARLDFLVTHNWDRSAAVTSNPQLCQQCHAKFGGDLKPNWDAYYFWAGQLPFRQDLLVSGTDEVRRYADFYTSTLPRNPRLKLLRIPNDLKNYLNTGKYDSNRARAQFEDASPGRLLPQADFIHRIENTGPANAFTFDNGAAGTLLFNQLQALNICRIENKIRDATYRTKDEKNNPLFAKVKYAVAGAMRPQTNGQFNTDENIQGCQNIGEFFPKWAVDKAAAYFPGQDRKMSADPGYEAAPAGRKPVMTPEISGSDFRSLYGSIRANTLFRQNYHFREKRERHLRHLTALYGKNRDKAEDEVSVLERLIGLQNREESLGYITKLRFILEPWKIDLRGWSLSTQADTYTFGDFFLNDQFRKIPLYKEVSAEYDRDHKRGQGFCSWAAEKSRAAYGEIPPAVSDAPSGPTGPGLPEVTREEVARFQVPSSCVACHVPNYAGRYDRSEVPSLIPGPPIPFDNRAKLKQALKAPGSGTYQDILDRISRSEDTPGRMPFPPAKGLGPHQQAVFKAWLDQVMMN